MKSLTPIFLIILSIGVFFYMIDPQFKKREELKVVVEENKQLIETIELLRKQRQDLQERYNNIGPDEEKDMKKVLPDTVDNVRLILYMENIARDVFLDRGSNLENISIQGSDGEGGESLSDSIAQNSGDTYGELFLNFSAVSSYEQIKEFFMMLQRSKRLIDITSFEVTKADSRNQDENSNFDLLNFNITLKTYWLR